MILAQQQYKEKALLHFRSNELNIHIVDSDLKVGFPSQQDKIRKMLMLACKVSRIISRF
jgi:hypothetical protein